MIKSYSETDMSRIEIEHDSFEIAIGWDSPLDTFFGTIIDPTAEEGNEVVAWLGMTNGEYRDVDSFVRAFETRLDQLGIVDKNLSTGQIDELQQAQDLNPPGAGMARKTDSMRSALKRFSEEFIVFKC